MTADIIHIGHADDESRCVHRKVVIFSIPDIESKGVEMATKVTAEIVRRVLSYDLETGEFRWQEPASRRMRVGDLAGDVKSNGRRYISVCGEPHMAHRLAWLYVTGEWPTGYVRHRNEQYSDNRWENLFQSTGTEANLDRRLGKNNTSGRAGVSYNARRQKWKAQIKRNWEIVDLGWFDTFDEACAARTAAEETLGSTRLPADEMERGAHHERIKQRQRTVWRLMRETYPDALWTSLPSFIADVGEPPEGRYSIAPRDGDAPVGPENFVWLAPPSVRFDMTTSKGRAARKREVYREVGSDKLRRYELRKSYDFTEAEIEEIIAREFGPCDLCGRTERPGKDGSQERLFADHHHGSRRFRGVLCRTCNSGIGFLGDTLSATLRVGLYQFPHVMPGEIDEAREEFARLAELMGYDVVPLVRKETA